MHIGNTGIEWVKNLIATQRKIIWSKLKDIVGNKDINFYQDEKWSNVNQAKAYIWPLLRENNDLPCDTEWCGKLKVPSDRGKRLLNKSRWLTFQSQEIETFISKDGGLTSFYQIFQINLSLSLTNTNITLDKQQNPNHQQPLGRRPNSIMARQKRIKIRCKGHECHAFAKAARNSYTKKSIK